MNYLTYPFKAAQASWNWLSAESLWNISSRVEKTKIQPQSAWETAKLGASHFFKNLPRKILISGLVTAAILAISPRPEMETIQGCSSQPIVDDSFVFHAVRALSDPILEKLTFRIGLQESLKQFEASSSAILSTIGSMKGRTLISTAVFSAHHFTYYDLKDPCSLAFMPILQCVRNIFDASYTRLYESHGPIASFSCHLINNCTSVLLSSLSRLLWKKT